MHNSLRCHVEPFAEFILSGMRFFAEFILSKNEILRFAQNDTKGRTQHDKGEGLRITLLQEIYLCFFAFLCVFVSLW
jgi:hypothetical protein